MQDLVTENMKLVYKIVHVQFSKFYNLKEDLMQYGMIGLCKAAKKYDTTKNFKFSSFAYRCIINEILMFLRKERKHINYCVEDETCLELEAEEIDFDNKIIVKDFLENTKNKRLWNLYLSGKSQKTISREMGFTQSYISRKIQKDILKYKELRNYGKTL